MRRLRLGWMACLIGLAACTATPPDDAQPGPTGTGGPAGAPGETVEPATGDEADPSALPGGEATPGGEELPGGEVPGTPTDTPAAPAEEAPVGTSLFVRSGLQFPTRLAEAPDGRIWVTDAKAGSAFVLDAALKVTGELKGIPRPLGIAVQADGRVLVGSAGLHAVLVYAPTGEKLGVLGDGVVTMPNDLALDSNGNVYVADSAKDVVTVLSPAGAVVRTIGAGELKFPAAVAVANDELWVGDQGGFKVRVYDLDGNAKRTFGSAVEAFSNDWQGRFVKLQSLAVDAQGRVHALDSYLKVVQVLTPDAGLFVESYGGADTDPGLLTLPLDLLITSSGQVLVANAESRTIEVMAVAAGEVTP